MGYRGSYVGPQVRAGSHHSGRQGNYFRSQWLRPGLKGWYKRDSNRRWRRMAHRDPENAPRKRKCCGWAW